MSAPQDKLTIVAATTMDGIKWQVGSPMPIPGRETTTRIREIFQVADSYVEIIGEVGQWDGPPDGASKFVPTETLLHTTLMPPTLMTLVSLGPMSVWTQVLQSFDPSVEQLEEVADLMGKVWRLNHGVPTENDKRELVYDDQIRVVKILQDGARYELFAMPTVGHQFERAGLGIQWTLMPLTVTRSVASLPKSQYQALLEELSDEDLEPEDETGDLPQQPQAAAVQGQAPQAAPAARPQASLIPDMQAVAGIVQTPPQPNGQGQTGA